MRTERLELTGQGLVRYRAIWDAKDIAATAVVLSLVAALYVYFSFWIG